MISKTISAEAWQAAKRHGYASTRNGQKFMLALEPETQATVLQLVTIGAPVSAQQFEVGAIYWTRSICDHDCIHSFAILGRTAKTVTVKVSGKTVRRGLTVYDNCEQFKPFGNYSMCAIIRANRKA